MDSFESLPRGLPPIMRRGHGQPVGAPTAAYVCSIPRPAALSRGLWACPACAKRGTDATPLHGIAAHAPSEAVHGYSPEAEARAARTSWMEGCAAASDISTCTSAFSTSPPSSEPARCPSVAQSCAIIATTRTSSSPRRAPPAASLSRSAAGAVTRLLRKSDHSLAHSV